MNSEQYVWAMTEQDRTRAICMGHVQSHSKHTYLEVSPSVPAEYGPSYIHLPVSNTVGITPS